MRDDKYNDHSPMQRQKSAVTRARVAAQRRLSEDGLVREQFTLPRDEARLQARQWLDAYPRAAYWSRVEHWQKLADGSIEFTMVRLPTAD